jgi:hypothetical protein
MWLGPALSTEGAESCSIAQPMLTKRRRERVKPKSQPNHRRPQAKRLRSQSRLPSPSSWKGRLLASGSTSLTSFSVAISSQA